MCYHINSLLIHFVEETCLPDRTRKKSTRRDEIFYFEIFYIRWVVFNYFYYIQYAEIPLKIRQNSTV